MNRHLKLKKNRGLIPLLLIVAVGTTLRFYNLNWDNYLIFHPDERNIDAAVARIHFFSQLNPGFFAYGGLPMYLYRAAGDLLDALTHTSIWTTDWGHINVIGRNFSALFSTLTIIVVYALGKKLFGNRTGLLASAIFAFCVASIQIAHFATTESFLILIITLVSYLSLLLYEKPRYASFLLLGIVTGLGIAAKTTAVSFIINPFLTFALLLFKTRGKKLFFLIGKILSFLLALIITFITFSPFTFLAFNKFLESMNYESGVATGRLVVPYTHQFDSAIPYLYEIVNLFWQMGPVFLFSLIGFFILWYLLIKRRSANYLFIVIFPLTYFLYVGSWHTKFIRYMSPLLPFFALYAAFALILLIRKSKKIGLFILVLFLGITIFWAFSYMTIYTRPQTRLTASFWIYKNIKPTDKVYTEHWDDGLPIHVDGIVNTIQTEQLTIYDNEFNNKAQYYADKLSKGNYIILATRRLYGSLMYLPKEYPVTSKYYKKLFNGELGYTKVAEFSSYPSLFGITINDDASEESFQVYDHPKIIIFKNTKKLNATEIKRIIKN